jgi:DNA-3-methyladenine glycosylase II
MDIKRGRRERGCTFEVRWPGPLDIPGSLEVFRRWGDDLIDRWDGRILVRTARIGRQVIPYVGRVTGTVDDPCLEVGVADPKQVAAVERVVQGMFVTAPEALDALVQTDTRIAGLEARYRGLRPVLQSDLLTALVRSISAQQVNLKWAAKTRRRLAETFGCRHTLAAHTVFSLEASRLGAATPADLRALQFTTRKAEYIVALAQAVARGELDLEALRAEPEAVVLARLTAWRGIGRWTAEWFLARALGRPCVSAGDLGVRKAVGLVYLQGRLPSEAEVRQYTAHWHAAAGVAQQLILQALAESGPAGGRPRSRSRASLSSDAGGPT